MIWRLAGGYLPLIAIALVMIFTAGTAGAQTFSDSFAGFSNDSDAPIEFRMDSFELDENRKVATLLGSVTIRQKDTVLKTRKLLVYYDGSFRAGGLDRISRMVATGRVVITSKDQAATGNRAKFNLRTEIVELIGDVVLTQGDNVIRGDRLEINLKTGKTKIISEKKKPIQMLIIPKSLDKKKQPVN